MRARKLTLTLVIALLVFVFSGCSALTQRQQLVASTVAFSAAVKGVDQMKKAGKLSAPEVAVALAALKEAEKGLDEWRVALDRYEAKATDALKLSIRRAVERVVAQVIAARAKAWVQPCP